jgi:hypothetical protein
MAIIFGSLVFIALAQVIDGRVAFGLGLVACFMVFVLSRRRAAKMALRQMGVSPEMAALIKQDEARGDHEGAVRRIATMQAKQRDHIRSTTGVDVETIIPEIGRLISWSDIVRHVFSVCEFDRAGTTIGADGKVHPVSMVAPYGYLLVESPILNQRAKLPIIHRDDFLLAASVFDDPRMAGRLSDQDMLVTYAPKKLRNDGRSGSLHHVLHYVMVPKGTLDRYYAVDDDLHMRMPQPEKLFGPFVYDGAISVGVNSEPKP